MGGGNAVNQELGGRGVQMDSGGAWNQVEEGGDLAVKRGGLDRVHSSDGDVSSLKGDSLDIGGREGFIDAIAELHSCSGEGRVVALDDKAPFSHGDALLGWHGLSRRRGTGWRRTGLWLLGGLLPPPPRYSGPRRTRSGSGSLGDKGR